MTTTPRKKKRASWTGAGHTLLWLCLGCGACATEDAARLAEGAAGRDVQAAPEASVASSGAVDAHDAWGHRLDAGGAVFALDATAMDAHRSSEPDAELGVGPDTDDDGWSDVVELACATDPHDVRDTPETAFLRADGSAAQPYPLCFPEQLVMLLARSDAAHAHVRLLRDLDLGGRTLATQLGSDAVPFSGALDGASHAISNFTLGAPSLPLAGLIAVVSAGAIVHDLRLDGVTGFAGALLAGRNQGTIQRVSVSGTSSGGDHLGLLVNYNAAGASIEEAASAGQLSATKSHVGGLVGESFGSLRRCSSSAEVRAENRAGGLVGSGGGSIAQSFATGSVSGAGMYIGGLLGTARDGASVLDAYALGGVTAGTGEAGGLVGSSQGVVTLQRCYAGNLVQGSRATRGILGFVEPGAKVSGGQCYFDTSLTAQDPLATGLSHAAMSEMSAFAGFDFETPVWRLAPLVQSTPRLVFQR